MKKQNIAQLSVTIYKIIAPHGYKLTNLEESNGRYIVHLDYPHQAREGVERTEFRIKKALSYDPNLVDIYYDR